MEKKNIIAVYHPSKTHSNKMYFDSDALFFILQELIKQLQDKTN